MELWDREAEKYQTRSVSLDGYHYRTIVSSIRAAYGSRSVYRTFLVVHIIGIHLLQLDAKNNRKIMLSCTDTPQSASH